MCMHSHDRHPPPCVYEFPLFVAQDTVSCRYCRFLQLGSCTTTAAATTPSGSGRARAAAGAAGAAPAWHSAAGAWWCTDAAAHRSAYIWAAERAAYRADATCHAATALPRCCPAATARQASQPCNCCSLVGSRFAAPRPPQETARGARLPIGNRCRLRCTACTWQTGHWQQSCNGSLPRGAATAQHKRTWQSIRCCLLPSHSRHAGHLQRTCEHYCQHCCACACKWRRNWLPAWGSKQQRLRWCCRRRS